MQLINLITDRQQPHSCMFTLWFNTVYVSSIFRLFKTLSFYTQLWLHMFWEIAFHSSYIYYLLCYTVISTNQHNEWHFIVHGRNWNTVENQAHYVMCCGHIGLFHIFAIMMFVERSGCKWLMWIAKNYISYTLECKTAGEMLDFNILHLSWFMISFYSLRLFWRFFCLLITHIIEALAIVGCITWQDGDTVSDNYHSLIVIYIIFIHLCFQWLFDDQQCVIKILPWYLILSDDDPVIEHSSRSITVAGAFLWLGIWGKPSGLIKAAAQIPMVHFWQIQVNMD